MFVHKDTNALPQNERRAKISRAIRNVYAHAGQRVVEWASMRADTTSGKPCRQRQQRLDTLGNPLGDFRAYCFENQIISFLCAAQHLMFRGCTGLNETRAENKSQSICLIKGTTDA